MSQVDPTFTTPLDIVNAALVECGAFGQGQTPMAVDISDASARLQWMLQQWERERFLVYHLVTYIGQSTGGRTYTVGPGAAVNTGAGSVRPAKLESAFLRQVNGGGGAGIGAFAIGLSPIGGVGGAGIIDYPLSIIPSMEDYTRITLKGLGSLALAVYYDPGWPLGTLYVWPVPDPSYQLGFTFVEQLPNNFITANAAFTLPYEYYNCMMFNLAIRLRAKYRLTSFPGDPLPLMAKQSLATLRNANFQVPLLRMPYELSGSGGYNIFGDLP